MGLATVVVAHPARRRPARALAAELDGWVSLDTEGIGAGANHRRAMRHGLDTGAGHILVVEDDALPVDGFNDAVREAIRRRPDQILGLYVGRQRPLSKPVARAVWKADEVGASWLTFPRLIWGVANVWPADIARAWVEEPLDGSPWDSQAWSWTRRNGYGVAYTWPSLVDHADTPSLVEHREPGRVAWRVGVPDWNDVAVAI